MTLRSLLPFLLVLALVATAMPAMADGESDLRAGSLSHEGAASHEGTLAALFVQESGEGEASVPWLAGQAASLHAKSYTITRDRVTVSALPFGTAYTPPQRQPVEEARAEQAVLRLGAFQPYYEVHVFALNGHLPYEAVVAGQTLRPAPQVVMEETFAEESFSTLPPQDLDAYGFSTVQRTGPFALHTDSSERSEITVRGDFVVELTGLTLDVAARDGAFSLASGVQDEPVADGAPEEAAAHEQNTFIRLFLDDAELTLAADGGLPRFEWASATSTLTTSGPVTFYHSYGTIGDRVLQDDRYVLEPGRVLAITPQNEGLAVAVDRPTDVGTRGTIAELPAPASAVLVGGGAILALAIAVGLGLLRRVLHPPVLADVESSIEAGQFRRAARQAARILARRPTDESALLARAIALTKGGQQEAAVVEVGRHLASRPASDGSLHYVLGLAQLELGQEDAGRASLKEAVRLTPSLMAEVAPRLGKAFSAPTTTARETNGYA